jgi:transposase InsO family protein
MRSVTPSTWENAVSERFVRTAQAERTARAERLDWLLVRNERHLDRVLRELVDHYNSGRPHRATDLEVPLP